MCFFLNIFRRNGWIVIKFCICIDIYKSMLFLMHIIFVNFLQSYGPWSTSEFCLCSIPCELICGFHSNFVYALILTSCRFGWLNNIFCSFSTELWPLIDAEILFMLNILWTNWWILIKFCKSIDTECRLGQLQIIFRYVSTELWPLIDVRILFPFNWWILLKFCVTNTWNFSKLLNRVIALDWCLNFNFSQYL